MVSQDQPHFSHQSSHRLEWEAALPSLAPCSLDFLYSLSQLPKTRHFLWPCLDLSDLRILFHTLPGSPQDCFSSLALHFPQVSTVLSRSCLFSAALCPEGRTHLLFWVPGPLWSQLLGAGWACCPGLYRNPSRARLSIPDPNLSPYWLAHMARRFIPILSELVLWFVGRRIMLFLFQSEEKTWD